MTRSMGRRGFTLIELSLTIILMGVIALMVSPLLSQGFQSFLATAAMSDMDDQARLAMERMCREIREIEDPTTIYIPPDHSWITFFKFGEGNITYWISNNNTLFRSVSLGPLILERDLLAENCRNPVFQRVGHIVSLQIDFNLQSPAFSTNKRFQSAVFLRNS